MDASKEAESGDMAEEKVALSDGDPLHGDADDSADFQDLARQRLGGIYLGSSSDEDDSGQECGGRKTEDASASPSHCDMEREELGPLDRIAEDGRFRVRFARQHRERLAREGVRTGEQPIVYNHATKQDTTGDVVSRVKTFFFDDLSFTEEFNAWAKPRAHLVDPDSDEMKLEYTTLHNEFVQFFEEKVEKVIASVGGSPSEFYQQLKKRVRLDATGADAQFTQLMLASVEFPSFIELMKAMARESRDA